MIPIPKAVFSLIVHMLFNFGTERSSTLNQHFPQLNIKREPYPAVCKEYPHRSITILQTCIQCLDTSDQTLLTHSDRLSNLHVRSDEAGPFTLCSSTSAII